MWVWECGSGSVGVWECGLCFAFETSFWLGHLCANGYLVAVHMIMDNTERVSALSLLSGGLDSQLAVCVLKKQGVNVSGVVFDSPFFNIAPARAAADHLGIHLHVINFSADIISLVKNPKHGHGSCMNPCIDCHALMLRRAGELMEEMGFDFLGTGEVLDERPMSQNRRSLAVVAKESGYGKLVVRPLSAQLLPETKPEQMGWVSRSRLLALRGRGRKPQMELAEEYGLKAFPSPAGGCLLTEPNFCRRLEDLKEHEGLNGVRSINMLRVGRHFRLRRDLKLVVGRNEGDNVVLEGNAELYDLVLKVEDIPGPTGLIPHTAGEEDLRLGAAICARYSDAPDGEPVAVRIRSAREVRRIEVVAADKDKVEQLRIG